MSARDTSTTDHRPTAPRVLAGGVLMGLANLVPGVSGGTMILALGLYDRFIDAVAELTTFRWSRELFVFLALLGVGLVGSVLGLSGLAVALVAEHRWVMYSLFIGMTLGGVPELVRLTRPFRAQEVLAVLVGIACMAALAFSLSEASLPQNSATLGGVGALAASSMILPGVSGSYVLLIFGLYDVVIGSLSASALREDPVGCFKVVAPVIAGAIVGVGLLSNVLKFALHRWRGPSHGLLMGLLLGSVLGLYPFQEPVHPELATRDGRKAVTMLVVEDATPAEVAEERGVVYSGEQAAELRTRYGGSTAGELKALGDELQRFRATGTQWLVAAALLAAGFLLTRMIGVREKADGAQRPA
jgi:putative membrane protein